MRLLCGDRGLRGRSTCPTCDILEPDDLADGLILGCQARPVRDDVHVEF